MTDTLDPAAVSYSNTYATLTTITCNVEADEVHTQLMAGFESACSERIRPFDDVDSEDEEVSGGSNWNNCGWALIRIYLVVITGTMLGL